MTAPVLVVFYHPRRRAIPAPAAAASRTLAGAANIQEPTGKPQLIITTTGISVLLVE